VKIIVYGNVIETAKEGEMKRYEEPVSELSDYYYYYY
jgi:hypothetical protein